jgi:butyryl-CoA dehydrogenase
MGRFLWLRPNCDRKGKMDFNLAEEKLLLQEMGKAFNESEITPIAKQIKQEGRLPDDCIMEMAKIGLLGITSEEQYEGVGIRHLN